MKQEHENDFPKSRQEARLISAKKYFTGKPCVNGHLTYRYTGNGECFGCHAALKRTPENMKKARSCIRYRRTGWTEKAFEKAFREQNGICAIEGCTKPAEHADHDHKTKTPREILCPRHNKVLTFYENPNPALIAYLKKWNV